MRNYEMIWVNTAENDLLKIVESMARTSPGNASIVLKKIKKHLSELYRYPERCCIVPELYDHGITHYREMIIAPWRIIFRISDSKAFVLSVLDSRQNIEDILLKRLTRMID